MRLVKAQDRKKDPPIENFPNTPLPLQKRKERAAMIELSRAKKVLSRNHRFVGAALAAVPIYIAYADAITQFVKRILTILKLLK